MQTTMKTRLVALFLFPFALSLAAQRAPNAMPRQDSKNDVTTVRSFLGNEPDAPLASVDDMYPRWRLLPSEQAYASIDGKHLVQSVNELTAIAFRYRDSGHQFWGRLIGFPPHVEAEEWVRSKFTQIGLSDVHAISLSLPPQWNAKSWDVAATGQGKTMRLDTAYAAQYSPGTPEGGLDIEAVYAGFGTEADYHGIDVRGKAVVIFSVPLPAVISGSAGLEDSLRRAQQKGAAAILEVIMLPGNVRGQIATGQGATSVPTFSVGMEEGYALRDMIGLSPSNNPARLKIRMTVEEVPNLKTSIISGTLPGIADEKVFILAHLDSWFEGATDNASGVATMLGLAEFLSKIPKEKRRRTIVFLGTPGHHNGKTWAAEWLAEHKDMLANTALVINSEHTASEGTHFFGETIWKTGSPDPDNWYMGGSAQFKEIALKSAMQFGVAMYAQPTKTAPGEMAPIYRSVPSSIQIMNLNPTYFHSDHDDFVPSTQLEAVTRAYAKLIADTDQIAIRDLAEPNAPKANNLRGD